MKFFASFKDKRFRYGTLSTVMILFAAAIFVFVNLVADRLEVTADLTGDKMYSISDYSKDYLASLQTDVTLYALMSTGQEDLMLSQILEEYEAGSSRVKVEYRDPTLYPTFVEQYSDPDTPVQNNSVIVVGNGRHKVISPNDMFTTEFDYNTYQEYVTSIDFEPQISKAIHYVTLTDSPKVYHVTGSGEYSLPEDFVSYLDMENYEVGTVDLVLNEIPEDCNMLIITRPQRDWSADEADRIKNYLERDGNALFILGFSGTRLTNLDNLLAAYGIRVGDYLVLEGDASRTYGSPMIMIPDMPANEITQSIVDQGFNSVQMMSTGIDQLELKRASTAYIPILTSSGSSYGKMNTESETISKEPGDLDGPFNLALGVTDYMSAEENYSTKMVVFGAEYILDSSLNSNVTGGTNWSLLMNCLNWMTEAPESIYVPSKPYSQISPMPITQLDANIIMLVSVAVLPLIFVAAGAVVWFRRRHS